LGADIVLDVDEAVSLEGNSGPYLQYAYARACSILAKSEPKSDLTDSKLDENERRLARKISEYPEVVEKAASELMPHHVCTYLYELAQTFNSFYETSRIIGDEREAIRAGLAKSYRDVLQSGLKVLNIEAPERM
jgi:arginyl-tRNA synthetase